MGREREIASRVHALEGVEREVLCPSAVSEVVLEESGLEPRGAELWRAGRVKRIERLVNLIRHGYIHSDLYGFEKLNA